MRVEGRPLGVLANNPAHLGGAIDSDAADKASRFLQLCDAFDLPILSLCDTPGFMVGPNAERTAQVRHCNRMFVTGANITVPFATVVLRKSYGLGALAMAPGASPPTRSWSPGPRASSAAWASRARCASATGATSKPSTIPRRGEARYEELLAKMYEVGKAVNIAAHFEIDDVIDPADTRRWIVEVLLAAPPPPPRTTKKHPVDPW